ncbi:MAG: hypothetical protein LUQ65_14515 [Candidatus Helarchaeota archaeon]|nr:hypothetical protein [Candidatus Helarchaeota archaeon]
MAILSRCFAYLGYKQGNFPKAENEVKAIPIYPELTDEMKDYVTETILAFFRIEIVEQFRRCRRINKVIVSTCIRRDWSLNVID